MIFIYSSWIRKNNKILHCIKILYACLDDRKVYIFLTCDHFVHKLPSARRIFYNNTSITIKIREKRRARKQSRYFMYNRSIYLIFIWLLYFNFPIEFEKKNKILHCINKYKTLHACLEWTFFALTLYFLRFDKLVLIMYILIHKRRNCVTIP